MHHADTSAGLPSPPDPSADRAEPPLPPHTDGLLVILHLLLGYARHLHATLHQRATARGFATLAQVFGTARLPPILTRLARGMRRLAALEAVLRARAARGRDLDLSGPHRREPRPPAEPSDDADGIAAPDPDAPPRRRRPPRREAEAGLDPDGLPSMAQLEAQIRRRPIGRTLVDICLDLGIAPRLCDSRVWNVLFDVITWMDGSVATLMREFQRRAAALEPELDRDARLGWPERSAEGIRRALGFSIGEPPALPAWLATPPPDPAVTRPP